MVRVKYTPARRKKKKKILKIVKGARGGRSKLYRTAREQVKRSLAYSYRDRKAKKRTFRSLWIVRINAQAEKQGLSYNRFINGLKKASVILDRKILADLAVNDEVAFGKLVEIAKQGKAKK